jgi:hypothetical protein
MKASNILMVTSILDLFKSKAIDGYVPKVISGKDIYEHFNFQSILDENYFFNTLCYTEPFVLQVNPGDALMSENWIDNKYGLRDPYLTQLRRETKLELVLKW